MGGWRRRLLRLALGTVGCLALMLAAAGLASALYPGDWQPVSATVTASRIEEVRDGTLDWAVVVDVRYEVAGVVHEGRGLRMFTDPAWEKASAAVGDWPVGRTVTVYYDAGDPAEVSRWADGGREALAVLAALMVPVLGALGFFVVALRRGVRAARASDRGR